jgi:peptidyl-tRNA hydrolase
MVMKMYAILRNDIWMDEGKAAAQAGHAFANVTEAALKVNNLMGIYRGDYDMGTKVVLQASYPEIVEISKKNKLLEKVAPLYCVVDRGHIFLPHFDGDDVVTAIGIGPMYEEEAEMLLGHLHLFRIKWYRRMFYRFLQLIGYHSKLPEFKK